MNDSLIRNIRENYDRVADDYAHKVSDELDRKPFDRELLNKFARLVAGRGEVCDMGCGPGHVARYLHGAGAAVSGLDLSPQMVEQARRLNPGIAFREGNMMALDLPEASLAAITAFYAFVNIPEANLPIVFQEMARVLQPGGWLLTAFHIGDDVLTPAQMWGHAVSLNFFYFQPMRIRRLLESAGFAIDTITEREPYSPEVEHQSRRAYILAHKSDNSFDNRPRSE